MAVTVAVPCPKCGKKLLELGGRAKPKGTIKCPSCGVLVDVTALGDLDRNLRKTSDAISKIGLKR